MSWQVWWTVSRKSLRFRSRKRSEWFIYVCGDRITGRLIWWTVSRKSLRYRSKIRSGWFIHSRQSAIVLLIYIAWNSLYPVTQSQVIIIFYYNIFCHKDLRMWKATVTCWQNITTHSWIYVGKQTSNLLLLFDWNIFFISVFFNDCEICSYPHSNNAAPYELVLNAWK